MSKRIILIGDSLLMPRIRQGLDYEDTYGYLVFKALKDHEVIIKGKYSNDTSVQSKPNVLRVEIEYLNPDMVFVQLGIVDCAPRLFSKIEKYALKALPSFLRQGIINFCSERRRFFTKMFPKVYVKKDDFETNMRKILEAIKICDATPVIINIARTSEENESRSFNYDNNTIEYNEILFKLSKEYGCQLIDFYNIIKTEPSCQLPDGVHLSKEGNRRLADEIISHINNFEQE
jgi:lysophospholipase L1-like esterase